VARKVAHLPIKTKARLLGEPDSFHRNLASSEGRVETRPRTELQ
jgi:hypothetical protein